MNSTAHEFIAIQRTLLDRLERFVLTEAYTRLRTAVGDHNDSQLDAWLVQWLISPAHGLDALPIDVADEPGGVDRLEEHLRRIAHNTG